MTQPRYDFSQEMKRIREVSSAVRIIQLENELQHLRNVIKGHKAFQTKLIRTLGKN